MWSICGNVHLLSMALAFSLSVGTTHALAPLWLQNGAPEWIAWGVVAAELVACGCGVMLGWQGWRPSGPNWPQHGTFPSWLHRRVTPWLVLGCASVGFVHSLASLRPITASPEYRAAARGESVGLLEFEVVGAATPGPTCRAIVHRGGSETFEVSLPSRACPLSDGQRLRAPSHAVRQGDAGALPGDPDPRVLASRSGVDAQLEIETVFIASPPTSRYWDAIARLRQHGWIHGRTTAADAFVTASVLGLPHALDPQHRDALRCAGLSHLVAVSGMHVGVAALLLHGLVVRFVIGRLAWPAGIVCVWLPVIAYVALTGASPSAVRAAGMLVMGTLAIATGRPQHGKTSLACTVAAMLVFRPAWVLDPGFQLSVAAMAALLGAGPGAGLWGQTWRVTWATAPISLLHFDAASFYGLVTNLLAVPMFTLWVFPTGSLGWLMLPLFGDIGLVPAAVGAAPILALAQWSVHLPSVGVEAWTWVAGIALVARMLLRSRLARAVPPTGALGVLVVAAWLSATRMQHAQGTWYVLGGVRQLSVIVPRGNGEDACVLDPTHSAAVWARLLPALGLRREVAFVNSTAKSAPHVEALQRGRRMVDHAACHFPSTQGLVAPLASCRRRGGRRSALLRIEGDGSVSCFVAGGWRELVHPQPAAAQ